jgi:DNA-binding HxlR family transcriptional regulator
MAGTDALEQAGHAGQVCDKALVQAFGLLGKRWNGIILGVLGGGTVGFAELRRGIGQITDSMLSDRLTELCAAGLVERSVTDARPPGVSYGLTAQGSALIPILEQLAGWAAQHLD